MTIRMNIYSSHFTTLILLVPSMDQDCEKVIIKCYSRQRTSKNKIEANVLVVFPFYVQCIYLRTSMPGPNTH